MKMSAVDIRTGMVLEHEGRLWRVSRTMHTQPGKGGAYPAGCLFLSLSAIGASDYLVC